MPSADHPDNRNEDEDSKDRRPDEPWEDQDPLDEEDILGELDENGDDLFPGVDEDEKREFMGGLLDFIRRVRGTHQDSDPTIPENPLSDDFEDRTPLEQIGEILSHFNATTQGFLQHISNDDNRTDDSKTLFSRLLYLKGELEKLHHNLKHGVADDSMSDAPVEGDEQQVLSLEERAERGLPLDSSVTPAEYKKKKATRPPSTKTLEKHSIDLTALARNGKLDPVVGVDRYVERMVQIIGRRKKSNVALIGEAGVGKTAIVEAFAMAVENDRFLFLDSATTRVVVINVASIVSGTKSRGSFETRMLKILNEIQNSPDTIIPFFDEMHTIIEAGAAGGEDGSKSMDAAAILRPYLSSSDFSCIGATTLAEYRKYVERNVILSKAMMPVMIEEPTAETTVKILKALRSKYEEHHNVTYSDEVLIHAVYSSDRFIPTKFFPDKSIDVTDMAGAIVRSRAALSDSGEAESIAVTIADIDKAVASESHIPLSLISRTSLETVETLRNDLKDNVVGQQEAITAIWKVVTRRQAGLGDMKRPIGSFLFAGPHGVGMDTVVRTAAKSLYGDVDSSLVHIDFAKYQNKIDISRLIGPPPGSDGYRHPGDLTERVKRKPHSIVFLDRIEMGHPGAVNLCLQLLEEGRLTDGTGTTINFRNAIIILATASVERCFFSPIDSEAEEHPPEYDWYLDGDVEIASKSRDELEAEIKDFLSNSHLPELIGRVQPVIFTPLSETDKRLVLDKQLLGVNNILVQNKGKFLNVTTPAREFLCTYNYDMRSGGHGLSNNVKKYLGDVVFDLVSIGKLGGTIITADYKRDDVELTISST